MAASMVFHWAGKKAESKVVELVAYLARKMGVQTVVQWAECSVDKTVDKTVGCLVVMTVGKKVELTAVMKAAVMVAHLVGWTVSMKVEMMADR